MTQTVAPTEEQRAATKLDTMVGSEVPTGKVLGLDGRGWRRGPPQDGGAVCWYEKPVGDGRVVCLDLEPGIFTGMISEAPMQKLGSLTLTSGESVWYGGTQHAFGSLPAVAFSELLRDLAALRS